MLYRVPLLPYCDDSLPLLHAVTVLSRPWETPSRTPGNTPQQLACRYPRATGWEGTFYPGDPGVAGPVVPRRAPFPSRFAKAHRASNPEIEANKGLRQRQKAERGERTKKKSSTAGDESNLEQKGSTPRIPSTYLTYLSNPGLTDRTARVQAVVTSHTYHYNTTSQRSHTPFPINLHYDDTWTNATIAIRLPGLPTTQHWSELSIPTLPYNTALLDSLFRAFP